MATLDSVGHIAYYMTLGDEVDERRLSMRAHVPVNKISTYPIYDILFVTQNLDIKNWY